MRYRELGKALAEVSVLGFGCMRLPVIKEEGKDDVIDEKEAIRIIRYGIDNGINYLDTAFGYHNGQSEVLVGKALKDGYRDKAYLATKLPLWNINSEEDVLKIFNEQLKKLDTDYIDFYLLHAVNRDSWEQKVLKFNVLPKIEKLIEEGKIKDYHMSLVLKDCDYDIKKVETKLRQYHSKKTKMRAVLKPYRQMLSAISDRMGGCSRDKILNLIKTETQITSKMILEELR